jgi:hypothetical protein
LKTLNSTNTSPESLFKSSLLSNEISQDIITEEDMILELETQYNTLCNVFNTKYDNKTINNCKIDIINLSVDIDNEYAIKLYEKNQFKIDYTKKDIHYMIRKNNVL